MKKTKQQKMENYENNGSFERMKMYDNEYLEMVKEFHETFLLPVRNNPDKITEQDFDLRIALLEEELDELRDSCNLRNQTTNDNAWKIEALDALCDLQYVLSGAILQLGFKDVFDDAFKAVHESNMTKLVKDRHSVELEMFEYKRKGVACKAEETKGGWIIRRSSDGKILKPSGYTPVDLSVFLKILNNS